MEVETINRQWRKENNNKIERKCGVKMKREQSDKIERIISIEWRKYRMNKK